MLSTMMSNMMIKPYQSPIFDNPENYDLDYEDVTFKTSDNVTLSGWLIKGNSDKVIIQSHFGVQCCRAGYTLKGKGMMKGYKEDIHFLNQAKYLNEAGYSVLMYDFRGHGQSETGSISWITWGKEEANDVIAAVDYISKREEYKNASIGLFSICMGQAAATNAFGLQNGLKNRNNIKAMISVQPLDYTTFIKAMGLPRFLSRGAAKLNQKRTGIDFDTNSFMDNVHNIDVPTRVIQNKNDSYMSEDLIAQYMDSLQVEKDLLWIDLPKYKQANFNRFAAYDWIGKNPNAILEWFGKYL